MTSSTDRYAAKSKKAIDYHFYRFIEIGING